MIYVDIPPKEKYLIIREMTRRDNNLLSITVLCDIAGVSRSGYYRWCAEEPKRIQREAKDRADFELILAAYQHRGYSKGARGIYMQLLHKKPTYCGHEHQKNPSPHGKIWPILPDPQGESLSPDGKGAQDQQCCGKPRETGI